MRKSRLLLLTCLLAACGGRPPAPPPAVPANGGPPPEPRPTPDTKILSVDGIDVTYGEVQPYVEFFDRIYPKWSMATKVKRTLEVHLLPLRFHQRDFAERRAAALQRATSLLGVVGNVEELREVAKDGVRKQITMQLLELPLALFLFDRSKIGAVSPPIELPQGYSVVGAFDIKDAGVVGDDVVDALQVPFFAHTDRSEYEQWLEATRRRCADRVGYVHPDFRNAMPEWLKLP